MKDTTTSNNKMTPSPFQQMPDSESADEASTTHHNPLSTIKEDESLDETGTTRHEAQLVKEEKIEEEAAAALAEEKKARESRGDENSGSKGGGPDISLRLHRKVAEIAAKAYRRASEQSNVLSRAKLADIALIKFDEIEVGKFLGKGSFSNVHEITRISATGGDAPDEDDASWDGNDNDAAERPTLDSGNQTNSQVQVKDPRKLLTMHHQRTKSGTYRYAIKFLKEEVRSIPQKYAVGTADLVVEGMFLASLAHPNIIKVRGLPEGGVKSLLSGSRTHGYFLILDRLFNTLSEQIYKEWKGDHIVHVKKKFGFLMDRKGNEDRNKHLAVRLKVAFDISAALKFLHSKAIIYRDLKPENLGFDVRGDIKLFDLGLVKELHPNDQDKRGNWRLSMAGTPRYMAPECGMYQPYNLSADVYSFSMLFWEIMTLEKPLKDFTYTKLKNEIFIDGDRPPIKKVFNKNMRSLIEAGWSQNPKKRPSIAQVYDTLRDEYLKLAPETITEGEVSHNRRRSTYVAANMPHLSVRNLMRLNSAGSDHDTKK